MKLEKINNEIEKCEKEMKLLRCYVDLLSDDIETEEDFKVRKEKIDEMMKAAKKMSELDTRHKKLLIKKLKKTQIELLKELIKEARSL